jgi:spermidine/putrescine transport system permease protein
MKNSNGKWLATIIPAAAWESLFLLLPLLAIVVISFLTRGDYGGIQWPFTLDNYRQLAGHGLFGFEPVYPMILLRSVLLASATAVLCAAAALPLAFFIAALAGSSRVLALVLLTIPIWTNILVRTYAWQLLLGPGGWISLLAVKLGLILPGQALYPSAGAVLVGLACDFLPFAALPLYASVEKLDRALLEAARDLGASRWQVFRHAIYPQIKAGLAAGVILVFLPALAQFVVPDLLGGAKIVLLGNALQQQFGASRDWPLGAAIATVSLLFVLAGILIFRRLGKEEDLT